MLKVKIMSGQVFSRRIFSKKNNREYLFREQMAIFGEGESQQPFKLSLRDDQAAYPEGDYELLPSSIDVDMDNRLALKRELALRPLQVAGGAAVAGVAPSGARPGAGRAA